MLSILISSQVNALYVSPLFILVPKDKFRHIVSSNRSTPPAPIAVLYYRLPLNVKVSGRLYPLVGSQNKQIFYKLPYSEDRKQRCALVKVPFISINILFSGFFFIYPQFIIYITSKPSKVVSAKFNVAFCV